MVLDALVLSFLAILLGLFGGLLRHGRLGNLTRVTVRGKLLLVVGVALPAIVDRFHPRGAVLLVAIALVSLLVFAGCNLHIVGMSIVALGVLANLAPLVVNSGMPVRPAALVHAGLARSDELARVDISGARRLERPGDHLTILGDIIPVRETRQVVSFGDLVLLAGVADVAANLTLRRRPTRARRLPENAGAALVAIAPPPGRTDADPVVDMRQYAEAVANGYAAKPDAPVIDLRDEFPPGPSAWSSPGASARSRHARTAATFDTIDIDETLPEGSPT